MEDSLADLFQPDTLVLHSGDDSQATGPLFPEQSLMLAVLEDAIRCIQRHGRTSRSAACREAVSWILEKNSDWPFSFENICAVLSLDADYLREGLLIWQGKRAIQIQKLPKSSFSRKITTGRVLSL
jgi:hypothetical protein